MLNRVEQQPTFLFLNYCTKYFRGVHRITVGWVENKRAIMPPPWCSFHISCHSSFCDSICSSTRGLYCGLWCGLFRSSFDSSSCSLSRVCLFDIRLTLPTPISPCPDLLSDVRAARLQNTSNRFSNRTCVEKKQTKTHVVGFRCGR